MNVAIHWQDADSSSNAMTEHFPDDDLRRACRKMPQKTAGKVFKIESFHC